MENFNLSVQRFDEFADDFAQRFMDIGAYSDSIDAFCSLIRTEKPRILELGCGPGNVTRLLKVRFPEAQIMAIDLAPRMIEIARQQMPEVDFRVMDVRNISAISEKFDAVMCSFCLPFLSKADTAQLIADCAELLMPNGVLYISTMEGDESKAGFEPTSFSGPAEIYFNYHNQADLQRSFAECGFEISHLKLQDFKEPDGNLTMDMIFIGVKTT
jgi:ubiquinone/menaquinone biosynthesis C-methylase UbiE